MKKQSVNVSRIVLAIVFFACTMGNLFPFLNIDLGFVILTPIRSVLIPASIWCFVQWCIRFRRREALSVLKNNLLSWLTFAFFAIWFVWGAAWILFGEPGNNAPAEGGGILTLCLLAFCFFTLVQDGKDVQFMLRLCVLCGVILAVLACVEVVIGSFVSGTAYDYSLAERIELKQTLFAPTTVFYNPNDFAAFMLLCITIVCYWIIRAETTRDFLGSMGIALILIAPTILTDSTIFNLLLGGLVMLTVLGVLLVRRGQWKTRLLRASGIVLAAVVFVLLCVSGIRTAAVALNRSYYTKQIQNYYLQNQATAPTEEPAQNTSAPDEVTTIPTAPPDTVPVTVPEIDYSNTEKPRTLFDKLMDFAQEGGTIYIRLWLMRAGWDFFLENPILGGGPDSFGTKIAQNRDYLNHTRWIMSPHCFYTELLSQYGIILFSAYMAIILYLVIRSLILTRRELREGRPGRGVICLLLTVMFSAVIIMPSGIIRLTPIWIFLLLAVCVLSAKKQEEVEDIPS